MRCLGSRVCAEAKELSPIAQQNNQTKAWNNAMISAGPLVFPLFFQWFNEKKIGMITEMKEENNVETRSPDLYISFVIPDAWTDSAGGFCCGLSYGLHGPRSVCLVIQPSDPGEN